MLWKKLRLGQAGRGGAVGSVRGKRPLPSEHVRNPPFRGGGEGGDRDRLYDSGLFNK